jgi:RimJ/RimL family protein N-acetyltransferase
MRPPVAETERLRLRGWTAADVDAFEAACNTPAVMRHLGGVQSREDLAAGVTRLSAVEAEFGYTFWVVERRADGSFLGFCGLKPMRPDLVPPPLHGEVEIGWRLAEHGWGQGYAREAAEAALRLGFERFELPRIVSMTLPANCPSWGLMRRLGMRARPDLDFDMPGFGRHLIYDLEKSAWTASRS